MMREKENAEENRRLVEKALENFRDTRECVTLNVQVDEETALKAAAEFVRRVEAARMRKANA